MKELLKLKDAFYCPLFIYFYHFFCSLYAVRKFDVTFQDENSCYVYLLKMFQVPIIDLEDSFLLRNIRNFTSLAICICCSKPRLERGERIEKKANKEKKRKGKISLCLFNDMKWDLFGHVSSFFSCLLFSF